MIYLVGHVDILFYFSINARVPGKMYQYEKVPNCMYWDNSVGTMFETSVC